MGGSCFQRWPSKTETVVVSLESAATVGGVPTAKSRTGASSSWVSEYPSSAMVMLRHAAVGAGAGTADVAGGVGAASAAEVAVGAGAVSAVGAVGAVGAGDGAAVGGVEGVQASGHAMTRGASERARRGFTRLQNYSARAAIAIERVRDRRRPRCA